MPLPGRETPAARQAAIMGVLRHERLTDPALGDLLDAGRRGRSSTRAAPRWCATFGATATAP